MDLTLLGLSLKESRFYNQLLLRGPTAVRDLEKLTGEQRTNCYAILKSLEAHQLVVRDDLLPTLRFKANDPRLIRKLLAEKQAEINNVNRYFTESLPKLSSLYRLTTEQQGVAYFTDTEGFIAVYEDMLQAGHTICSFISETIVHEQPRLYEAIVIEHAAKRGKRGIASRLLACTATAPYLSGEHFSQRGVEVRVLDADIFDGEITIYGNKVALTSYKTGALQTLVLNNKALAKTFQAIFDTCWTMAK
jgi:sugar-specific transcriptional regulator TrmB